MKESRILKAISYIVLPILIASIILSIISIYIEENYDYDSEKYFLSQTFVSEYMNYLSKNAYNLIHDYGSYTVVQNGDIEIHFETDNVYGNQLKNRYFLIIYKNKALTNVELTPETNTIETVKKYIEQNPDSKKVNIIFGNIESDSETMQSGGHQYLNRLTEEYYTINNGDYIEYKTAEAKDFEIYSSYQEELQENSKIAILDYIKDQTYIFKEYSYFIIPLSSILILLIIFYLIISVGHKKGVKGIDLNDFDKIPLEIIILISTIIAAILIIILSEKNFNKEIITLLLITTYFIIYVLSAITINTIIKRIKSKKFIKTTIIGIILSYFIKLINKIKNMITCSMNLIAKICIYLGTSIVLGLLILIIFKDSFITVLFEFMLICYIAYKLIKVLNQYKQIENKLKEMYEGNNSSYLDEKEFIMEFRNVIKYLNDISNGFDNAIQERIKSEKFKTELITNVSHDIKTPLTSIINYVDLLKQENIKDEKIKDYINILDNKSQRLKKLTEDLIEASKVSTGNISLNLEKINIVELIKQAVGEFEDKFQKRKLEIIIDSSQHEINIMADSRYMYRIIENLFSNISKYALESSRVYIDIKYIQEYVSIEIKNISKDKLNISEEQLMQRFVRGDKSRTTEGSGLGISIAQELTKLQGGEFKLKLDGDLFKVELKWKTI